MQPSGMSVIHWWFAEMYTPFCPASRVVKKPDAAVMSFSTQEIIAANPRYGSLLADVGVAELPKTLIDAIKQHGIDVTSLPYVFVCSPFIADVAVQIPESLTAVLQYNAGVLPDADALRTLLQNQPGSDGDQAAVMQALREFRRSVLALIGIHDLLQLSDTAVILRCLSDVADVCITAAVRWSELQCQPRFGKPHDEQGNPVELVVMGMGKLGGQELNFSSDVDLIFLFEANGETREGRREYDNQEYFRRVGQLVIKLLDEATADGFVYRVDMRLRPFGSSGPLAMSFEALESYLLTQGRDWERYAWTKSRVVCGSKACALAIEQLLRPFIYRRYLDYAVFDSLRDLKRQIGVKAAKSGRTDNVKLGRGGIREIEFIVQSFQLVRGGREPVLQNRNLVTTIKSLVANQHLSDTDASSLLAAYDFLRQVENRLQMVDDRQTHELPATENEQLRLALSMRCACFAEFEATLGKHSDQVHQRFSSVFSLNDDSAQHKNEFEDSWLYVKAAAGEGDGQAVEMLHSSGIQEPDQVSSLLGEFARSGRYLRYENRAQDLIDKLVPKTLRYVSQSSRSHAETLQRVFSLYDSIAGRVGYLQLLCDSQETLENLVTLFAESPWLSEFVASHPMVLDELLDIEQGTVVSGVEENTEALQLELSYYNDADLGELMDIVRHFQQSRMVRIAAADISGALPLMKVSDGLSWLAEAVLNVATAIVQKDMQSRHGRPTCLIDGELRYPEFAIVAYGKLGGLELGYGSDLDIVFVHESSGDEQISDGDRPLENQVYFSRLAQKLVNFITTLTGAGVLYDIDTRLRPNGRAGVLVSAVEAFLSYQRNEAWIWEHQALVRARVVVGSARLRDQFQQLKCDILGIPPDARKLLREVVEMRERMRTELARDSEGTFDLKQGTGGIADIEFMVQYSVLLHASKNTGLLKYSDNIRQLTCLENLAFMDAEDAQSLMKSYLYLRGRLHRLALLEGSTTITVDDDLTAHRQRVSDCWQKLMEPPAITKP